MSQVKWRWIPPEKPKKPSAAQKAIRMLHPSKCILCKGVKRLMRR